MAIDFPENPGHAETLDFQGVRYIFNSDGLAVGYWTVSSPGTYGAATVADIDGGVEGFKYIAPLELRGSRYLHQTAADLAVLDGDEPSLSLAKAGETEVRLRSINGAYQVQQYDSGGSFLGTLFDGHATTGQVKLYYGGVAKLRTLASGIDVVGQLTTSGGIVNTDADSLIEGISTGAADSLFKMRNTLGGLVVSSEDGDLTISHTDTAGVAVDKVLKAFGTNTGTNTGVVLYNAGMARLQITSYGALVTGQMRNDATPADDSDLTRKAYVDSEVSSKGTMSSFLWDADGSAATTIAQGETIGVVGGTYATTERTGNVITVNVAQGDVAGQRGAVRLSSSLTSVSETHAATAAALGQVNTKAVAATYARDSLFSGSLTAGNSVAISDIDDYDQIMVEFYNSIDNVYDWMTLDSASIVTGRHYVRVLDTDGDANNALRFTFPTTTSIENDILSPAATYRIIRVLGVTC